MDLNPALQTFLAESTELLAQMEQALLELDLANPDRGALDAIFRAAHTIKGSAGVFGFDTVVAFTHRVESVLDRVRAGELAIDVTLVELMLSSADHMSGLVGAVAADAPLDEALRTADGRLSGALAGLLDGSARSSVSPPATPSDSRQDERRWHLVLRFGAEVLRNGMDPLSFLRYLATLGQLDAVSTSSSRIPALGDLDPEACYLDFELDLVTAAPRAAIEAAFEFVREDCEVRLIRAEDTDLDTTGSDASAPDVASATESAPIATVHPVPPPTATVTALNPAPPAGRSAEARTALDTRLIRVDADKLDQLINLVGELVTAGAATQALAQRTRLAELLESAATMGRLVAEVRDCALGLRMVQIGATFQRFQRVVHDVSRELGKQIDLVISGGETELDKSVVEKIADPLMHLVRNAMDHGIEAAEDRTAAGKPAVGTLRLNAFHDSGSIVIEVADDGGGLNRERILAKAVERGMVSPGASLSDREIYQLVFEPGFSTAAAVSNLSGRGVGMDVVRRNIEQVRGSVDIDSERGVGTTVRIRLPLTLAIIDGFLVGIEQARFVVPLEGVVECAALRPEDRAAVAERGFLNLRGEVLPVLRLRETFGLDSTQTRRENIVVVRCGERKAGLVVDELLGEFQTVIKPLGKLFMHLKGISGATLLGSGEVALILDVPGLIQRATRQLEVSPALCA